jgi:protein TonB
LVVIDGNTNAAAHFEVQPPRSPSERSDTLATMLFVAALFHGVLILGISFSAGDLSDTPNTATSMEVVLLNRAYEARPDNADAEYLAQQNLAGAGGSTATDTLRVAYGSSTDPVMPGLEQDGAERAQTSTDTTTAAEYLYANTPEAAVLTQQQRAAAEQLSVRTGMPGNANSVEIMAAPDTVTAIKGAQPRQLIISASTRESRIAAYLGGWKRRVERVGTLNFPRAALAATTGRNPVLEVSIAANGKLNAALILTSSGSRELDMAAVDILQLSSPFDPFPEYLLNDYDEIKFSYEWQFRGSRVGSVRVPTN